ncbi:MAG: hypothetical protein JST12_03405 [Armatimonadetes bacterium]|nr:hypothetical protein [Armatimonadota bacterium]MBS1700682.1 hypothetical protein [Armatimonadota bacterium]MBS1728829.1 hypothetical protein [Armatimonadota bacterium]
MSVSFQNDILPFLYPWREQMMWRLDLTSYQDVKMNAPAIWEQIDPANGPAQMPPPPLQPLTPDEVSLFQQWMNSGFPP